MTVKDYKKGHLIHYDKNNRKWVYFDNNTDINIDRNCKNCGRLSLDYDECLGWLGDKVASACCGHGVEKGYIVFKDGRRFEEVENHEDG